MKKIISLYLLCCSFIAASYADVSVDWIRSGSGTGTWSATDSLDNVFVTSWEAGPSVKLRKYDEFGNEQWEKTYSTPILFNYLYPSAVYTDSDGNAVVVGYRYTSPTQGRNANAIFVLKYDTDGEVIFQKIIDGTFSFFNNSAYRTNVSSVMGPDDNLYIGTAGTVSGYPTTGFNTIKVSTSGAVVWVSSVNMTGNPYHFVANIRLKGNRIALAGHNQYWLANAAIWVLDTTGVSKFYHTEEGIGGQDALIDNSNRVFLLTSSPPGYAADVSLYRYKANGTFNWNKKFDFGGSEFGYRMQLTPDNRIALLAYGNQTGISLYVDWLTMKINLNGLLLWSQRYDEHHNNDEIPSYMAIDKDGDIFVTGIGGPFPGGSNLGARQFVTVKYTSSGIEKWAFAQDTLTEYATGKHISIDSRGNLFVVQDAGCMVYHLLDNAGTDPCSVPASVVVSAISDESATVSWAPVTNAYLYHVQYKTTTALTWNSISTDDASRVITGLFSGTTYQYRVEAVCSSGPTGYTSVATFVTTGASYCTTGGSNASSDWIDLTYVNDLLNSTPDSDGGYSDFTYLTTDLQQGVTYSMTLSAGMAGGTYFEFWKVWIDFNSDGDLTDAGEEVVSYSSDQIGWESHSFTVPSGATTGNTLMRVSMKRGSAPSPCGTYAKGETEDYTVNIIPAKLKASDESVSVKIYPNPAKDILQVAVTNTAHAELQVMNMSGELLMQTSISEENTALNIAELKAGMYLIVLINDEGLRTITRFVKMD